MKKEKPILFSTEMVRAILGGRKTQTRRPVSTSDFLKFLTTGKPSQRYDADVLWVRETWCDPTGEGYPIVYKADMPQYWDADETSHGEAVELTEKDFKWKPSIHMPREFSRMKLAVESVEIDRLQDISEDDAKAEGVQPYEQLNSDLPSFLCQELGVRYKPAFSFLWDSIYEEQGFGWDNNPWVWVIKFKLTN